MSEDYEEMEEELLDVDTDITSAEERSEHTIEVNESSVSDVEELLSVASSSTSVNHTGIENENTDENGRNGPTIDSGEQAAIGNSGGNSNVIRSFRTRIDDNGETIFEFSSDDQLSESESELDEPEEHVPDASPSPWPLAFDVDSSETDTDDFEYVPSRFLGNTSRGGETSTSTYQVVERSTLFPNSIPTASNIAQRVTSRRSRSPAAAALAHAPRPRPRHNVQARKKRKRKAKKKPAKPKAPKIRKPPRPPAPKVIIEKLLGEGSELSYKNITQPKIHSRVRIHFESNSDGKEKEMDYSESCYKVGEIFLKGNWSTAGFNPVNQQDLMERYPGLIEFSIGTGNVVEPCGHNVNLRSTFFPLTFLWLKTEEKLTAEESALRPRPKLSKQDMKRPLMFVLHKYYVFRCNITNWSQELFESKGAGFGNKHVFRLDFVGFHDYTKEIRLDIKILKSYIMDIHELQDIPYKQDGQLGHVFNRLFAVDLPPNLVGNQTQRKEDIPWFYGQIKKYHTLETLPRLQFSLQPDCVAPTLRSYQRNAVHWMLFREGVFGNTQLCTDMNLVNSFLGKMYTPITLGTIAEHHTAYYNPDVGYICRSKPTVPNIPSGGILADEMGLGKTVEVICLILLNPRPEPECEILGHDEHSLQDDDDSDWKSNCSSENDDEDSDDAEYTVMRKKAKYTKVKNRNNEQVEVPKATASARKSRQSLRSNTIETPSSLLHPNLRRKRNVSPCTFSTEIEQSIELDEVTPMDGEEEPDHNLNEPVPHSENPDSPSNSVLDEFELPDIDEPEPHNPAKCTTDGRRSCKRPNKSTKPVEKTRNEKLKTEAPTTTYQKVKAIYDAELLNYTESRNRQRPRFNGTFFETTINKRASFECICGGDNDDDRRKVMTCFTCNSSQHAECVGFDRELRLHFSKSKKGYQCPHCTALEELYPAKTTLIITPNAISHQWINELQRHVRNHSMNILFYKGVATHGYIPPIKLAEYDIVIATYGVLSTELNYVDLPHSNSDDGRRFRNPKRFMTIPSPLPFVYWWRVCLDEAQMVEGINTKMSIMAMRLTAVHRWCITGTPINQGLQDLFGLFAFLGVQPVALDYWWDKLVQQPFLQKDVSLLFELFGKLIWRTGKMDVLDQLGIPPQTELARWLNFSPVENHFYKQQHEICSKKILDKIARLSQTSKEILGMRLSSLDRQTLQSLMLPFLELRQACCHPQMVKGQSISLQKGTLTMEELLAQLVKKTSLQCAEDHRAIVSALNGMAGVHMIKEEWFDASEKYREVLQSAEKNKEQFHTDSLQLLHTMENLADLLDRHHDGIPYTLRDDSLRSEAEELKKKYLEKYATGVKSAQNAVDPLTKQTEELYEKFQCQKSSWWASTLAKAARLNKIDDLLARIKDDLVDHTKKNQNNVISLGNKFNDANGLQNVLVESITQMESLRQTVLEGLEKLQKDDPSMFLNAAISCHLRKKTQQYYKESDELGFRCQVCLYHDQFLRYEGILFKDEKKNKVIRTGRKWQQQKLMGTIASDLTEEEKNLVLLKEEEELIESLEHVNAGLSEQLRKGTWGDSETERILKFINNFARINGMPQDVREDGSVHIKLFEAMKKEFRVLRILWRQIYDQISATDELGQATTRLCLQYENTGTSNEPGPSRRKKPKELQSGTVEQEQRIQNINILQRHELDIRMTQMQLDLDNGKETLSIHLGQLLYLDTLKKNGYGKKGSVNSDECPVCHQILGRNWATLRCGHSYCTECIKKISPVSQSFLCPLCRHSMKYVDVSFVDTRGDDEIEGTADKVVKSVNREIRGSHSTKVEAIIDTVLQLQDTHPGEKVLIFSTWPDVLEIIAKGLKQNDINNCVLNQPGKKFQTELNRFKTREDIQVLMMPLASGSKGLNIIEATHILLVEPILNLASELQAIGRIHRIGQTKPTFIHRFYVKNTIEEQLFEVLKNHDVSSDNEGALTVADLKTLIRSGPDESGNVVSVE